MDEFNLAAQCDMMLMGSFSEITFRRASEQRMLNYIDYISRLNQ